MLKQISIFAENKKGAFQTITQILMENDINILGSVTNDSTEFGTIRMIVSDTEKSLEVLKEKGYVCRTASIIGVEIPDAVGSLNQILKELLEGNINLNYTYLCFNRESGMPVIILSTEDVFEVENYLKSKGYNLQ